MNRPEESAPASVPSGTPRAESVELAGLRVLRWTSKQLEDAVFDGLAEGRGGWILTANVDHLARAARDPAVAALYREADVIVADGRPLLWASRLLGAGLPERVAGSDLVWQLGRRAARDGRRLFFLGGSGDDAERAAERLRQEMPGIQIVGCSDAWLSSPPTEPELAPIRQQLRQARAELVFAAMSSPKQEEMIRALRPELAGAWVLGCGAGLGFVAGSIQRAPPWMQRAGIEWLHRLMQEPRRLVRRYLVENLPFLLGLLARSALQRFRPAARS